MQLPMQQPIQWLMQSPIMARWREGRRQLDNCIWKPSGCLFHDFLLPFGSLLAPCGHLGRPFLNPGTTPGPFRARGAKSCEKVTNWLNFGGSRGPHFEAILVKLMTFQLLIFCSFLGAHFAHKLQFRGPFGVQFAMLFGAPGTLGNRVKR